MYISKIVIIIIYSFLSFLWEEKLGFNLPCLGTQLEGSMAGSRDHLKVYSFACSLIHADYQQGVSIPLHMCYPM